MLDGQCLWALCTLMQRGRWRRSVRQRTGYFPWMLYKLEGLCLWALCTLMHNCTCRVRRRRVASTDNAKLVIFRQDLCWKVCDYGLCAPCKGEGGNDVFVKELVIFPACSIYWKDCVFGLCVLWCTCRVRRGGWRQSIQQNTGYFLHDLYFKALCTLMHMQSEKGRVAMMRRMETRASSRAQHPGPSGSAAKRGNNAQNNHGWRCKRSFK